MCGWGSARGVLMSALVCVGCGAAEDGPLLDDGPPPAGPKNVLAAGPDKPCAIRDDGAIVCWRVGESEPVPIEGLEKRRWHALSAGNNAACSLSAHGSVWCWDTTSLQLFRGPAEFTPLHGRVDRVVVGEFHACAMIRDGSVECWGLGNNGELGDGKRKSNFERPVRVEGLEGTVVDIAAGSRTSWALMDDGRVYIWGGKKKLLLPTPLETDGVVTRFCQTRDVLCQVREGSRFNPSSDIGELSGVRLATRSPGVDGLSDVGYLGVVLESGEINSWWNSYLKSPERFLEPENPTELGTGYDYGCVVNAEGVWCWGNQASGTAPPLVETPTRVEL